MGGRDADLEIGVPGVSGCRLKRCMIVAWGCLVDWRLRAV
jgi:hypothetical protein